MIKIALQRFAGLLKYFLIALISVTISRILLLIFNIEYFKDLGLDGFIKIFWHGLRFDLSASTAFQAPFLLLYFIPFKKNKSKIKHMLCVGLFSLSNFFMILFNCIDSIYFRFTLKRSTADLFTFITKGDDTLRLLPRFLLDYWFIPLIIASILWGTIIAYQKVRVPQFPDVPYYRKLLANVILLIFAAGLTILSIRGGFQLKPLRSLQAAEVVGVNYAPLVLNSPFTIMKTLNKQSLERKAYFGQDRLGEIFSPIVEFPYSKFNKRSTKNIIIVIMESFSKEYMGPPFGLEDKTPFLDSLAREGVFFERAFANGKKSIDGIPAILAGVPSLMEDPYITSIYSTNKIKTIASILSENGYTTSFFHGGTTGTMGFDAFSKLAGFENYYGMEDFTGPDSYDGNWGIFDEPFFQYFVEQLEETPEPFFTTFFSLSSHHPYTIPEKYKDKFSEAKHPLLNTIAYSDMALKKFFTQAKEMPWYNNTLFVITADHTGQALNPSYATQLGSFAVPVLFYAPADDSLKGVSENVFQHIDIQPSILGYLGYDEPFYSFGKDKLENFEKEVNGYALNYLNNVYQFIQGEYVLHFDGEKSLGFYNYQRDSLLQSPLDTGKEDLFHRMESTCKAIIQTYNHALIDNTQVLEKSLSNSTQKSSINEN